MACVDETRSSTKPLYNIGNGLETASYVYAYALCGRHARFFAVKDPAVPQTPVIAIIDDDASVRAGIGRLMRSLGYIGRAFASADEFMQSSGLGKASCVITDVHMPGMSGLELQSLLNRQGHRIPIIFITAFPEDDVRQRAMTAGAVGFLAKPFEGGALVQCIEAALKQ